MTFIAEEIVLTLGVLCILSILCEETSAGPGLLLWLTEDGIIGAAVVAEKIVAATIVAEHK